MKTHGHTYRFLIAAVALAVMSAGFVFFAHALPPRSEMGESSLDRLIPPSASAQEKQRRIGVLNKMIDVLDESENKDPGILQEVEKLLRVKGEGAK